MVRVASQAGIYLSVLPKAQLSVFSLNLEELVEWESWEDSLTSKLLTVQVRGPEPIKKSWVCNTCIPPSPGRQSQVSYWGLLASQPCLLSELQAYERICLRKQVILRNYTQSGPRLHMYIRLHACTHTKIKVNVTEGLER